MTWTNSEIEYEGFPLLLRKPDYINIGQFKNTFTQLVRIEHFLEKVKEDGLPESSFNKLLADFDNHMCSSLIEANQGIIFLIETFAGKRIYYYYTLPNLNLSDAFDKTKAKYNVNIATDYQNDSGWGFLDEYPVSLYSL